MSAQVFATRLKHPLRTHIHSDFAADNSSLSFLQRFSAFLALALALSSCDCARASDVARRAGDLSLLILTNDRA